jgi:two-component system response regulator FixJ
VSEGATVYILDDDPAIRDSLSLLLEIEGYEVHVHSSAMTFLTEIEGKEEGGCVVTDVRMPKMTGIELLDAMKERHAYLPMILITAHADVSLAVQAMKKGAVDFLEKPFNDEALLFSIRQALQRRDNDDARNAKTQAVITKLATLTKREKAVLSGLLKGKANKMIAHDLGISVRTVEVHRATLMIKMDAKSLPELVQLALAAPQTEE